MDESLAHNGPNTLELPRDEKEMTSVLSRLNIDREKLREYRTSVEGKEELTKKLQEAGLNGQTDRWADMLPKIDEQLGKKQRYTEGVRKLEQEKPGLFRRVWNSVKKHPVRTAVIVAALTVAAAAGAAYLAGGTAGLAAGVEKLMGYVGMSHLYGTGAAAGGAEKAAEAIGNAIETVKPAIPDYFAVPGSPSL